MTKKKEGFISKDELETYLGRIFDYKSDGDSISFQTEYGYDDFFMVSVTPTSISCDNESGGGYVKDDEDNEGFKIENADDIASALDNACDESDGWVCY